MAKHSSGQAVGHGLQRLTVHQSGATPNPPPNSAAAAGTPPAGRCSAGGVAWCAPPWAAVHSLCHGLFLLLLARFMAIPFGKIIAPGQRRGASGAIM
jgi:hypothetical protein